MSVALMTLYLRELGAKADYFIPDRFQNNHAATNRSIELALSKQATILITVDIGITSYTMLDFAHQNNIDVIVCDHHEPGNTLPKAFAILNPIQPDCPYPFKYLAACGVAFKLIYAISIALNNTDII
jgi:single-stranded-DNA-specific exonuclease